MGTAELLSLVEHLEDNIDELEENLEPLITTALSTATKTLPVLDRAKLYVLIVYSIESLLFSYLRLHGIQAKEHPVFRELTRVRQYFEKIKAAETQPAKPNIILNKAAAGRFIKHALASNNKIDLEQAEREARERVLLRRKLGKLAGPQHQKVKEAEENEQQPRKRSLAEVESDSDSDSSSESESTSSSDGKDGSVTEVLNGEPAENAATHPGKGESHNLDDSNPVSKKKSCQRVQDNVGKKDTKATIKTQGAPDDTNPSGDSSKLRMKRKKRKRKQHSHNQRQS